MGDIRINKVVIHELVKDQHKDIKPSNLRDEVLDPEIETVQKLVDGVASLYGKKNNTAHYGTFQNDGRQGTFPNNFNEYTRSETVNNDGFMALSLSAMTELYRSAMGNQAASGGYILFSDYSNDQGRFFLVAMIKQKEGIRLSDKLDPEELSQLDLGRLYQAAKINIGKLSAYKAARAEDKQEMSYLSFVSPSANKTAAGYFITALGCAPGTAASKATDTVIKASTKFFRQHDELNTHSKDFKLDLLDYLKEQHLKNESVKLSEIERLARKYIPADDSEKADGIADDFISFLNNEENAIPVEFPANKRILKKYRQINYKSDNWDLSFERIALGETDDAQVYYDRANKRIILSSLPDELVEQIQNELDNNGMN